MKPLKLLLTIHALLTFAAGMVLILQPGLIPRAVQIELNPDAYLICYLLGAAELSIAFLSFSAKNLADKQTIRLVAMTFILFHCFTAVVEFYSYMQGTAAAILGNIALRIIVSALFGYYGIYKMLPVRK